MVPSIDVDVGTTGGVFDIQGLARGWGNSEKGRLVSTLLSERIANPLVALDEIDAGQIRMNTTRGSLPGLYKVLMAAIEHSTAAAWVCPFFQVPIDIRNVSWIATCNDYKHIDQALLERMMVVELQDITRDHLVEFARKEAQRRFGEEFSAAVGDLVEKEAKRGYRLSLRHVTRILDRVEQLAQEPIRH